MNSATKKKDLSVALRTPSVILNISRRWWMSSEQNIYICLEHDKSDNEEMLLRGSHF